MYSPKVDKASADQELIAGELNFGRDNSEREDAISDGDKPEWDMD